MRGYDQQILLKLIAVNIREQPRKQFSGQFCVEPGKPVCFGFGLLVCRRRRSPTSFAQHRSRRSLRDSARWLLKSRVETALSSPTCSRRLRVSATPRPQLAITHASLEAISLDTFDTGSPFCVPPGAMLAEAMFGAKHGLHSRAPRLLELLTQQSKAREGVAASVAPPKAMNQGEGSRLDHAGSLP